MYENIVGCDLNKGLVLLAEWVFSGSRCQGGEDLAIESLAALAALAELAWFSFGLAQIREELVVKSDSMGNLGCEVLPTVQESYKIFFQPLHIYTSKSAGRVDVSSQLHLQVYYVHCVLAGLVAH